MTSQPLGKPVDDSLGEETILFGGSGFLGQQILRNSPKMVSVGRRKPPTPNRHVSVESLTDLSPLRRVPFRRVIYAIGNSDRPTMQKERHQPGEPTPFDHHVIPLIQTLERLMHHGITKFVHCSTILLYDDRRMTLPVSEDAPLAPYRDKYVVSKYLAEELCAFYSRWIPIVNLRLANMYGPAEYTRFDVIHVLIRQLLDKGRADVQSTKPERDFIYVEDVADAVMRILGSDYTGTLNVGTGTMASVGRITEILERISGCTIRDLDGPVAGPMQFQCDVSRLRKLIDWRPRYSIEEGVTRTFEMMKLWRTP